MLESFRVHGFFFLRFGKQSSGNTVYNFRNPVSLEQFPSWTFDAISITTSRSPVGKVSYSMASMDFQKLNTNYRNIYSPCGPVQKARRAGTVAGRLDAPVINQ